MIKSHKITVKDCRVTRKTGEKNKKNVILHFARKFQFFLRFIFLLFVFKILKK